MDKFKDNLEDKENQFGINMFTSKPNTYNLDANMSSENKSGSIVSMISDESKNSNISMHIQKSITKDKGQK
jgi:hypothetical protein